MELRPLFEGWFEGEFDNWTQAASNPTSWAHIFVTHEKIDDHKYLTKSRYNYMNTPYREQVVEVTEPDVLGDNTGIIIVKNPACDMIFSWNSEDYCFEGISQEGCTFKDKPLDSKAKLFPTEYHTWDKGYWHGSEGFFTFVKKL
jgi:hypothetical protein|tara:strand:- start:988 stop:1419 length:432 start_codon:yes stop_codon:yes gene_type:complete